MVFRSTDVIVDFSLLKVPSIGLNPSRLGKTAGIFRVSDIWSLMKI